MLQNSFYAILGTFYTLLNNTDLYLSYFILSYVFLGHNDSVKWGLTVLWLYGLFSVLKTLYGAVILWFDHFLDSGAEICQILVGFLENLKTSERHS